MGPVSGSAEPDRKSAGRGGRALALVQAGSFGASVPAFLRGGIRMEWFTEAEQRMSFYAAVADGVSPAAGVDRTPVARQFSRCAPQPDLPGDIPFLTASWWGRLERGLAVGVIEQVLQACPGPGQDVFADPLIPVRVLDATLRNPRYRQDGYLMVAGAHDSLIALRELETRPGELVRTFWECARQLPTVEAVVEAYRRRQELLGPEDPAVPAVVAGVLRTCLGR